MSLILPLIKALGYDPANPADVSVEYEVCKGAKVDVAIMQNNKPIILVECKHCNKKLNAHDKGQLQKYFNAPSKGAEIGILTNGKEYWFFTDADMRYKMDDEPFMKVDILDIKKNDIEMLEKLAKQNFVIDEIRETVKIMRLVNTIKTIIHEDIFTSTARYKKYLLKQIGDWKEIRKQSSKIVDRAIEEMRMEFATADEVKIERNKEMNEFLVRVKDILQGVVPEENLFLLPYSTYYGVYLKGNGNPSICRLEYYSSGSMALGFYDNEKKKRTWHKITSLDEINEYADKIVARAKKYLG